MGNDGVVTAYMLEAKRFGAIPAAGHGAFFVIEPPLPNEVWERWTPYFVSQRFEVWEQEGPNREPFDFFAVWRKLLLRQRP
jgi:hypothetical protein